MKRMVLIYGTVHILNVANYKKMAIDKTKSLSPQYSETGFFVTY